VDAIKMGLRVGWLPPPATAMCPAYLDSKFLMCTVTGSFRKCDDKEKIFFNLKKGSVMRCMYRYIYVYTYMRNASQALQVSPCKQAGVSTCHLRES
jgi:hypothetical protein